MGRHRKNWNVVTIPIPRYLPHDEAKRRVDLARQVILHGNCLNIYEAYDAVLDDLVKKRELFNSACDALKDNLNEIIQSDREE